MGPIFKCTSCWKSEGRTPTYIENEKRDKKCAGCGSLLAHLWSDTYGEDTDDDMVNAPPHYNAHPSGVECIQITEHMNFNLGNVIKYVWRADEKGKALEDLKKAQFYLDREIAKLEKD